MHSFLVIQQRLEEKQSTEPQVELNDSFTVKLPSKTIRTISDFNKKDNSSLGSQFDLSWVTDLTDEEKSIEIFRDFSLDQIKEQFQKLEVAKEILEESIKNEKSLKQKLLQNKEKDNLLLAIEQYKLAIMQAILQNLRGEGYLETIQDLSFSASHNHRTVKATLYTLSAGGMIAAMADGLIAGVTMFAGFPAWLVTVLSITAALFNAKLYQAVEVVGLKEALDFNSDEHLAEMMTVTTDQTKVANELNTCLLSKDYRLNCNNYIAYSSIIKPIHTSIQKRADKIQGYQESTKIKRKRWSLTVIGAALTGAFAYFSVDEAIASSIALGLMSTPPGWLIAAFTGLVALTTAVTYLYAVKNMGMFDFFNPQAKHMKDLVENIKAYGSNYRSFEHDINQKIHREFNQELQCLKTSIVQKNQEVGLLTKRGSDQAYVDSVGDAIKDFSIQIEKLTALAQQLKNPVLPISVSDNLNALTKSLEALKKSTCSLIETNTALLAQEQQKQNELITLKADNDRLNMELNLFKTIKSVYVPSRELTETPSLIMK